MSSPVRIVIPVYGSAIDVERCVNSVMEAMSSLVTSSEVVLIDDASPDRQTPRTLERLVERHPDLIVERNDVNLGFVGTANRGIAGATGDVVLLNSDTIVTRGWLDELHRVAQIDGTGSVTPLTNEGSLATVSDPLIERFRLLSLNPDIVGCSDHLAQWSPRLFPEVIAGVGFCLYLHRSAIDAVGLFDTDRFGRGYGEEVDWCIRATQLGFVHRIADHVFVYHRGGRSFGSESTESRANGSATLHARYPWFEDANRLERRINPLATSMAALEIGLHERDLARPHVLHVLQAPSAFGGTERHLEALIADLDGVDASLFHPTDSGMMLSTRWGDGDNRDRREFLLPGPPLDQTVRVHDDLAAAALQMALDLFSFDVVHIHNLLGHSLAPLDVLADFPGTVVCSVHDLFLACPNHHLLFRNQVFCGLPDDDSVCAQCLPQTIAQPVAFLHEFRETARRGIQRIDQWVFFSWNAVDYFRRIYDLPDQKISVVPHGSLVDIVSNRAGLPDEEILSGPLRLAFVGRGWTKKGQSIANQLAVDCIGSDVEIHHFGEDREPAVAEIHAHGPYENQQLAELLDEHRIHVVLLPGPYAETFGLVMTEALAAGRPVIGPAYGAIAERILAADVGWLIEPTDRDGIRRLVEELDHFRPEVLRVTQRARTVALTEFADTIPSYRDLYFGSGESTNDDGVTS